jgi:hypothetical protein
MRLIVCTVLFAGSVLAAAQPDPSVIQKVPLRFEQDSNHLWTARSFGFGVGLSRNGATAVLGKETLGVEFVGGNVVAPFVGERKSKTPSTHFSHDGNYTRDAFLAVRRKDVYPGVDVVFYGQGQSLEYDFELDAGADVSAIRMQFDGSQDVRLTGKGELVVKLAQGEIVQKAPVTFQRTASGVVSVASSYVALADGTYGVRLGNYDHSRAVTVDPQMLFTAYLAGTGAEAPLSISQDRNGSIYIAGYTSSDDFPLVGTAYTGFLLTPNQHVFTSRLNPLKTGDDVLTYSGYFGGMFGDSLRAAVVDPNGVLYMTGITDDFFFPTTANAYAKSNGERRKMFLSVLDTNLPGASGLKYSTFFGGNEGVEEPTSIALGPISGQVYIAGFTNSIELPTKNAIQSTRFSGYDAFVAGFDTNKSGADSLLASTYFGGSFYDRARSIVVDRAGKVYIAGETFSYDFPVTPGAYQTTYRGGSDAFVAKLDMTTAKTEYATFIGGSSIDQAWKILLNGQGHVAVGGFSISEDYPTTPNAMQPRIAGESDATLTILDLSQNVSARALTYSTFYGGSDGEVILDMRIGFDGRYYIGGYTLSRDLKTVDALRPTSENGSTDGFVAILDVTETPQRALAYSSFVTGPGFQMVNGIEVDAAGNVYVTGQSFGNVFSTGGAAPPENGSSDVFIFVFRPSPPTVVRSQSQQVQRARERQ